jgi:hypothetical protein
MYQNHEGDIPYNSAFPPHHSQLWSRDLVTMPFEKIASITPPEDLGPRINYGDDMQWYFAIFKDLTTEHSKILHTGVQNGTAGAQPNSYETEATTSWLLAVYRLYLGEKSIWKKGDISVYVLVELQSCRIKVLTSVTSFVQIIRHQPGSQGPFIFSASWQTCIQTCYRSAGFAQIVRDEVKGLEGCNLETELRMADGEIDEFSCVLFKDHWSGENSALLDTATFGGRLDLINIRRGYTQGAWALALRRLGAQARAAEAIWREKEQSEAFRQGIKG